MNILNGSGVNMRATMKDIARECGVSAAAVSLALSGKSGRISERMRVRILETAERLKYTPNRAAVSLATNRSRLIGVIITDLRNTHISSKFMAIDKELQKSGYSIVCYVLYDTRSDVSGMVSGLLSQGVEGIIYEKPATVIQERHKAYPSSYLNTSGVPVICSEDHGLDCPGVNVCFNYERGGYLATKHLIECGHTRIGCLSGPVDFVVSLSRLEGYKRALHEAGIPYDDKLVCYGDFMLQSGNKSLSYLLGKKVTAIFSFNDEMAFGLYQSARQYGVRIPDDISIIGFDNVPFSDVLEVPLSTISVPVEEMGRKAARELISMIEGGAAEKRKTILYEPDLILRGSIRRV